MLFTVDWKIKLLILWSETKSHIDLSLVLLGILNFPSEQVMDQQLLIRMTLDTFWCFLMIPWWWSICCISKFVGPPLVWGRVTGGSLHMILFRTAETAILHFGRLSIFKKYKAIAQKSKTLWQIKVVSIFLKHPVYKRFVFHM